MNTSNEFEEKKKSVGDYSQTKEQERLGMPHICDLQQQVKRKPLMKKLLNIFCCFYLTGAAGPRPFILTGLRPFRLRYMEAGAEGRRHGRLTSWLSWAELLAKCQSFAYSKTLEYDVLSMTGTVDSGKPLSFKE